MEGLIAEAVLLARQMWSFARLSRSVLVLRASPLAGRFAHIDIATVSECVLFRLSKVCELDLVLFL